MRDVLRFGGATLFQSAGADVELMLIWSANECIDGVCDKKASGEFFDVGLELRPRGHYHPMVFSRVAKVVTPSFVGCSPRLFLFFCFVVLRLQLYRLFQN